MKNIPVDIDLLNSFYQQGHISAEALTAIAPIKWLAVHHPELLKAICISDRPKPKTCRDCVHYSSTHQFCKTRIDDENTYLPATETTPACQVFEGINLPPFLKTGGNR